MSGPKAGTLISLFNYYELENPWPMLIKAHQSAEGESGGLGLQNNPLPRTEQRAQRCSLRARLFVPVCLSVSEHL